MSAGAQERPNGLLLTVISMGTFLSTFIAGSISVALPDIGAGLHLSFSTSLWVVTLFFVVVAILLVPFGRLADARGRSRCYLAGLGLVALGSLAAGVAGSGALLLGARALQGVGGALVAATGAALMIAAHPPTQRGRALGWNVMAVYLGFSAGPTVGAFVLDQLGWRALFLLNAPLALAALAAGWRVGLARLDVELRPVRLDVGGLLTLATWISATVVVLTFVPLWGVADPATLACILVAVAGFVAFVAIERRVRDPLLDVTVFARNRAFSLGNAGTLVSTTALFGLPPIVSVFMRVAHGASAQLTGLVLLLQPLLMALASPLAGRLSDRVDSRRLMAGGMVVVGVALAAGLLAPDGIPAWWLAATLAVVGLGQACFGAPNNAIVYGAVPRTQLGLAAGVIGTTRYVGQTLSLALLGGIVVLVIGVAAGAVLYVGGDAGLAAVAAGELERAMRLALVFSAVGAFATAALCIGLPAPRRAGRAAIVTTGAP